MAKPGNSTTSLESIGKLVKKTIKATREDFKHGKPYEVQQFEELTGYFLRYQQRIERLTEQIYQCELLTRFIPMWLAYQEKFNVIQANPSPGELEVLDKELRVFIGDSVYDHLSYVIYSTNFDQLPEIEKLLVAYRAKLKKLDEDFRKIQYGDISGLQKVWTKKLRADLFQIRMDAEGIKRSAEGVYEAIIKELRQANSGFFTG